MSFLGDLLGGITGTVGGVLDNKADSWLNKLLTGEEYAGQKNDKKALAELEELKKAAKARQDPNFQKQTLNPNLVDYSGTVSAPTVTAGQSAGVNAPQTSTYNPGTLTNALAGDPRLADLATYDPTFMDQLEKLTANQMTGQQIDPITGYTAAQSEAAKIDGPATYEAERLGQAKKIQDNAALKAQLEENLGTLQQRSKEGFDATDRMMNNEILSDAAKQATRQNEAVTQDLQNRGVAGGGSEIQRRLAANAAASGNAHKSGIELAKQARDRKDAALKDASTLATSMRGQDVDISKADTAAENNFALANQAAGNAAKQFNAGATNDVNKTNAGFQQQTNLANTAAKNDESQFNKNLEWNQASKNADLAQETDKFNTDAKNTTDRFNQETLFNTNKNNQDASNRANEFNTGQTNQNQQFNASTQNQRDEFNVETQNEANKLNFGAQNDAAQFNAGQKNHMADSAADRTQQNNQFNVEQKNNIDKFNATNLVDINKYNQDNKNAQSKDNANIKNANDTSNRDFNYNVEKDNYTAGQNNFTNQLNIGKLLSDYYFNASDRDARLAAAAAAQQGSGSGSKGTSGGFLSGLLGTGVKAIGSLFGFEDGGLTPEGVPYVVGESGPEWAVNTPGGTAVAPMQTGHFESDMMNMFQNPQSGGKPAAQTLNKDKEYYFPPKYDFRG